MRMLSGWEFSSKRLFELMPACLKDGRVLENLVNPSLWGITVAVRETWRNDFISSQGSLTADGSRAVMLGYCFKSGVQQVDVTQRKALGASTACIQVLLVDRLMAELATWALRTKGFSRKCPPTCKVGGFLGILFMLRYGE